MVEKKNLLIIDNTTALISPWKNNLKAYFKCIEVVGGFEAQSKLKAMDIACLIVNLSLQSCNGLDVVMKIRQKNKQIPIVVIAEKSDLRFVRNASQFGINGYFLFPFDGGRLLDAVVKATGVSIAQIMNELEAEEEKKGFEKEEKLKSQDNGDIPSLYYEGQSFLLHEDIDKAIEVFNQIFNTKMVKDTCRRYWEESIFQLGRCLIKKEEFQDAIEKLNLFMQRAPNSDLNKQASFLVGECYENMKNIDKALSIYRKLIDMPPFDSISTKARKRVKALQK